MTSLMSGFIIDLVSNLQAPTKPFQGSNQRLTQVVSKTASRGHIKDLVLLLFKQNQTMDRVMALSMRPRSLKELVGQQDMCASLTHQFSSGRIPHFFIICGSVGAGKTTLARIIALMLQLSEGSVKELTQDDWQKYRKLEIQEINAANQNGVDDIRRLIEAMRFKPLPPSKAKVIILDEAHQLTLPAQNALITETEDVAQFVYYIFCTSAINKIIPALKRRAFMISPRPLDKASTLALVRSAQQAVQHTSFDPQSLTIALHENGITAPGLVLQAAERYFSGIPAEESVLFTESCKLDAMAVCRALAVGDWSKCCLNLRQATKSDVYALRSSMMGYLKTILLKSTGAKAGAVSQAILNLEQVNTEDSVCLPSFLASVCLACENLAITKSKRHHPEP